VEEEIVEIRDVFIPNIITPNNDSKNETFTIHTDATVDLTIFNRWGKMLFNSKNYQNDWNAGGLPAGVYYYELKLEEDASCQGWIQVLR
jgi:gliding motility-associated-like protein